MPNANEVATIVAGGKRYESWQSVEVERLYGAPISHFRFVCAEPGPNDRGWADLQLMPGDPAEVYLAGRLAMTGVVQVRQAAYDATAHAVEIVVASYTEAVQATTVDAAPGQYLNSSLQQIASAVCGKVGVTALVDNVPGADKLFERVSEHVGETRIDFLRRLAQMRNLHLCDDASGTLLFSRGATAGSAALIEGVNILKARIILDFQWTARQITAVLQNFGNDQHWGDGARANSATVQNPAYTGKNNRPLALLGPMPGDQEDALALAQHERSLNDLTTCEATVTVPGWLMDDGTLWMEHLRMPVTIHSPMLVPQDPFVLLLRGVKHMQSNENGSTTELNLCIPNGLGDDRQITSVDGLV